MHTSTSDTCTFTHKHTSEDTHTHTHTYTHTSEHCNDASADPDTHIHDAPTHIHTHTSEHHDDTPASTTTRTNSPIVPPQIPTQSLPIASPQTSLSPPAEFGKSSHETSSHFDSPATHIALVEIGHDWGQGRGGIEESPVAQGQRAREECYRALPPTPPGYRGRTNCNTSLAHVAVALSVCMFEHLSMMN